MGVSAGKSVYLDSFKVPLFHIPRHQRFVCFNRVRGGDILYQELQMSQGSISLALDVSIKL